MKIPSDHRTKTQLTPMAAREEWTKLAINSSIFGNCGFFIQREIVLDPKWSIRNIFIKIIIVPRHWNL